MLPAWQTVGLHLLINRVASKLNYAEVGDDYSFIGPGNTGPTQGQHYIA